MLYTSFSMIALIMDYFMHRHIFLQFLNVDPLNFLTGADFLAFLVMQTINLAAICTPADYNTRPLDTIYSNFIDALPVVGISHFLTSLLPFWGAHILLCSWLLLEMTPVEI